MKKLCIYGLILALLMGCFPPISYAIYDNLDDEAVVRIMMAQGYDKRLIEKDGSAYFLNPHVYREYNIIVYSAKADYTSDLSRLPENQPASSNKDANGEWRVLGYSKNGTVVYNDRFIPDVTPEGGHLSDRHWFKSSGARDSWLDADDAMIRRMLAGKRVMVDANVGTDTVTNILGTSVNGAMDYAFCQAICGLRSDGTMRMYHRTRGGQTLYWALRIGALEHDISDAIAIQTPADRTVDTGSDVNRVNNTAIVQPPHLVV